MLCMLSILPAVCEGSAALLSCQWQLILTSHKKRQGRRRREAISGVYEGMRLRGYDEIWRKLQIHWCGANLGTCGKVAEDEAGSVWCVEDFVLCSKVKEAGRRYQTHILQTFLWQLCGGWGGEAWYTEFTLIQGGWEKAGLRVDSRGALTKVNSPVGKGRREAGVLVFAYVTILISFNMLWNSGGREFEVRMAVMGHDVSFRQVACVISIYYLVEMFCKWLELKRKD